MTYQERIIKSKVGLLQLAEELGNVSQACKVMGFSRDTFYRYKTLKEEGGLESLAPPGNLWVKSSRNPPKRLILIKVRVRHPILYF